MKAGTVGTKRNASKATSGRSDDGDDGSWNGEMKEAVPPESRKLERGDEERWCLLSRTEAGIEESNLAWW